MSGSTAPTVDLDFTTGVMPVGVTFTRPTGGTYFDNQGVMQTAGVNAPRFDYDPILGVPLGLLMELNKTNLVPNPRGEGAVAGSPGTDPTGWNTNSVNVTRTIATGTERGLPYVQYRNANAAATTVNSNFVFTAASTASMPMAASSVYTFSVYVSFPAGSFAQISGFNLRFNQYDSGGGVLATLASGTFALTNMAIGDAITKTRVNFQFTTASNCAFVQPFLQIPIAAGAVDFTVRLAGIQVELGSQVTSVILPPVGTPGASTRGIEFATTATVPGINLLINTIESETIVSYTVLPAGSGLVSMELDDGTTNNCYVLRNSSPNNTNSVGVFSAAASVGNGFSGNFSTGVMKQASVFDGTALTGRMVQNAGTIAPFTFTANPVNLTRISVGYGRTSSLNGWMRRARYWPRILADAELQQATGPDTMPTLDLNLIGPNLPPLLTFTRSTTGTYVDATGTVQTAAINAPRFGYDPISHAPLGLLIEETRTNLIVSSSDWSTAGISPAGSVLPTANAAISPDGTMNATSVVTNDTITNGHLIYKTFVGANSTTYCGSVFVKVNGYPRVSVYFTSTGFAGNTGVLFDLTTATIVTIGLGSTVTITPFPNGWYRVSVTATSNTAGGPYIFAIQAAPAGQVTIGGNFTSAATGLGIFMWGAQVETSAFLTAPTSYIPTTTTTVTRAFDLCSMPTAAWYSVAAGSFAVDGTMQQVSAGNQDVVGFDDGSINNCTIARVTSNQFYIVEASAGVGGASANTANTVLPGVPFRAAMTYNAGTLTGSLNGGAVISSSGTAPVSTNRLNLSAIRQAAQNGFKSRVRYWPRVLANVELQEATSLGVQARAMVLA